MGIVFGCERLSDYVIDNNITVETDHKSLVNIINKSLTQALCCILKYSLTVSGLSNMLYDQLVWRVDGVSSKTGPYSFIFTK